MAISKYTINVLFGLGYLYIQLYKPQKAEHFLACLVKMLPEHKQAKILLCISQVMQGKKISADDFNFARQHASPSIVQMLARRTNMAKKA
ncbi:MAG: hypothetical protein ABW007_27130 [Chitinophagaceae bacterium]